MTSFFWIGVALTLSPTERLKQSAPTLLLAGLAFGAAFLSKFQAGLLICGWGIAELLDPRREISARFQRVTIPGIACLGVIALGGLLDWVGYGRWQLTPLRYFEANFIRGAVFQYSAHPAHWYFSQLAGWALPLSTLLLLVGLQGARRFPERRVSIPVFIYFLFHAGIPNKELRFLVPLFPGFLLFIAHSSLFNRLSTDRRPSRRVLRWGLLLQNTVLLAALSTQPAEPVVSLYRLLETSPAASQNLFTVHTSAFELAGLRAHFYRHPALKETILQSWDELPRQASNLGDFHLIHAGKELPPAVVGWQDTQCTILKWLPSTYRPHRILGVVPSNTEVIALTRCHRQPQS